MRRTELKRKTPPWLNPDGDAKKRRPLPQVRKRPRLVKLESGEKVPRRELEFGAQAELCRKLPCVMCWWGKYSEVSCYFRLAFRVFHGGASFDRMSDPHHETHTRGSGRGRDEHCIPLCRVHHDERGAMTRADFEARYHGIDLRGVAAQLAEVVRGET